MAKRAAGTPPVTKRSQSYGALRAFRNPVFKKRSIRTLQKHDQSKGVEMPEFRGMTNQKGVDTGRGFTASPRIMRRGTLTPPVKTSWQKEIRKAALGPLQRRSRGV
jgi:hypothetical protein